VRLLGFRRHPVSEEELSASVDGRLSNRQRERVEAHLQSCADCRRKLEELRFLVAELRALPETKAPRSFALSPEMAAATRREAIRERHEERTAARRIYLGLSGATVAAAILLIAVVGSDVAFFSRGGGGESSTNATTTFSREAMSPAEAGAEADGSIEPGDATKDVAPGVAPLLPTAVAPEDRLAADAADAVETPSAEVAAAPQQARPVAEDASHLWLWIVEGAAGGLIVGFGASAFWMRRRWVQMNRS